MTNRLLPSSAPPVPRIFRWIQIAAIGTSVNGCGAGPTSEEMGTLGNAGAANQAGAGSPTETSAGAAATTGTSVGMVGVGGGGGGATPSGGGSPGMGSSAGMTGTTAPGDAGGAASSSGAGGTDAGGTESGGTDAGGNASGGAGAGAGGGENGGAGGATIDPGGCPADLEGFATLDGDMVNGTTGGGDAAPVRPTTAEELLGYASDSEARVIEIEGTFDVPRLEVASNKTLIGVTQDATLNGGIQIRGYDDAQVSNVILRNFHLNGATTQVDNDALQIYFAHHVWIDHLDIYDGRDGNLDMTHAVNWVTVSWTKFHYTANYARPEGESADHRFSSLIGHSDDNAEEDDGRLKVTFHHNWWTTGVIERMPRVRFGQVHVYNNLFDSDESNYCIRAGIQAHILSESNYFDGTNDAHQFNDENDQLTAHITSRNNIFSGTTGTDEPPEGGGTPFAEPVPYETSMEGAMSVPDNVRDCAGPR